MFVSGEVEYGIGLGGNIFEQIFSFATRNVRGLKFILCPNCNFDLCFVFLFANLVF